MEQVAIAAESTSVATTRTFERAQGGMQMVENVIDTVRRATNEVERTAQQMHSLRERARQITSIVEMISSNFIICNGPGACLGNFFNDPCCREEKC